MDNSDLERALKDAQAAVIEGPRRRRELVMLAREQGWSKYKIAAVLGVKGPTVDSIVATAEREAADSSD